MWDRLGGALAPPIDESLLMLMFFTNTLAMLSHSRQSTISLICVFVSTIQFTTTCLLLYSISPALLNQ